MTDLVYGRHPVTEALRAAVPISRILLSESAGSSEVLDEIRRLAETAGVAVVETDRDTLAELAGSSHHQGAVAEVEPYRYRSFEEVLSDTRLVLLDGITDPQNLGSVLRNADAFGFPGVLIPSRRAVPVTPAVRKVSAGASEQVRVVRISSAAQTVGRLQGQGYTVVGLHVDAAHAYDEVDYPHRICLVVGSEGSGLSRLVIQRCDFLVSIPLHGHLGSLNAAVAAAIVMSRVARADQGPE